MFLFLFIFVQTDCGASWAIWAPAMHHTSSTTVSEVLTTSQNALSVSRSKTESEDSSQTTQSTAPAATESSDKDRGSIYT